MPTAAISGQVFLDAVRPALEQGSARALTAAVRYWQPDQVRSLLHHPDADVRRAAALVLGYMGDRSCIGALTRALHDADEGVNAMAEHGLWLIWFRSGRCKALGPFREGIELLNAESYQPALAKFREAIELDPEFAEAWNQCAIAHSLMGQPVRAIKDCRETLRRMPQHFGALCGMGNAFAQLGHLTNALACYRRALAINPRMPAVAAAAAHLQARLRRMNDSSGVFEAQYVPA